MDYQQRVRCRDCRFFELAKVKQGRSLVVPHLPYLCTSKKTVQWCPIDGWVSESGRKDPRVMNKHGDCIYFRRKTG